jgi:SAM-dependent methyltransferase
MWNNRLINANPNQPPWNLNPLQNKVKTEFKDLIDNGTVSINEVLYCQCGSKRFESLTSIDRFGLPFGSKICKDCGLVLTDPIISSNSLSLFYENIYHPLTFGNDTPENVKFLFNKTQGKKIYNKIIGHVNGNKLNVLEIGCGAGFNLLDFKKNAESKGISAEVFGIEYNSKYVEYGCKKLGLNIMEGDLDSLNNTSMCYDVVILSHVFEHFIDLMSELDKIKSVINENTLLYIEVPGILDLKQKYEYNCDFLRYFTCAHIYHFSLGTLTNIMRMAGFQLVEGNEKVEAIYKLSNGNNPVRIDNNYDIIVDYLRELESNLMFYQSHNPNKKIHRRLINKVRSYLHD